MRAFHPIASWVPFWAMAQPAGARAGAALPEQAAQPGQAAQTEQAQPQQAAQPEQTAGPEPPAARAAPTGNGQLPRRWFHEHFDNLWRLVARLGVPRHSVDDVVQEVFITASRRQLDIQQGQERRFLIGTAVRVSANYRSRACVRRELAQAEWLDHASDLPSAEQLLIQKRAREQLEQVLERLPEPQRSVFVLYELEGFSVAEISELLQLPGGTVASRLGRARARFSQLVARLERSEPAQESS